jgi:signal transduction histidine kinase
VEQVRIADRRVRDALDEAARAGAAKDQFLAVLGHELRNPLAPISNVLLLLDRKSGDNTARERAVLRRQVRHMTRLVDDLLDVARLVEGKLQFKKETVELSSLVAEVTETFRQQEPAAKLDVACPDESCVINADGIRIAQVITNLLINACRHSAGKPIRVEIVRRAGMVEVVVMDQGEGMSPETLAGLFRPFYQAHANAGSLGLGLAIVKGIVEQHGGSVSAHSPGLGAGSSFSFTLPLTDTPIQAAPDLELGTTSVAN